METDRKTPNVGPDLKFGVNRQTNQSRRTRCQWQTLLNHAVSLSRFREKTCGRHTPHPSKQLSETADEAGHTDDSIGNGNTTTMNVVHGQDEGRAGEGEEAAVEDIW